MRKVSVIIASYNPTLERILFTIDSVLNQKDVDYELIITDDASKENYFDVIENYIKPRSNCRYLLLLHEKNQGTVKNILDAVKHASGNYIRTLGVGDAIYGEYSLKEQAEHLKNSGKKWSFGQMLYFSFDELGNRHFIKHRARPQLVRPYINGKDKICVWNYCVLSDIATGTAILYERQLLQEYLELFQNRVKYTEDYVATLMSYDGYVGAYYPAPVVCYEFGDSGLTSPTNTKMGKKVYEDILSSYKVLLDRESSKDDSLYRKIRKILFKRVNRGRRKSDILYEKGRLLFAIRYRLCPRYTSIPKDESCLRKIEIRN